MGNKTSEAAKQGWIRLPDPPSEIQSGSMTQLNSKEFMIATKCDPTIDDESNYVPGFYIFNITTNEWRLWMKYPKQWEVIWETLLYDQKSNELYLWHQHRSNEFHTFIKINMMTKEWQRSSWQESTFHIMNERHAVNTEDYVYLIGGPKSISHVEFDKNKDTFNRIHDFLSFSYMHGIMLVYVRSKKVLLMFGGDTGNWKEKLHVREYSLEKQEWRKIDGIKFKYYKGDAVLTRDENHVILVPVYNLDTALCDVIYILDIMDDGQYELRKSSVRLPHGTQGKRRSKMISLTGSAPGTNDELLYGFVRKICIKNGLRMVPDDIMNVIDSFYDCEMLHLVRCYKCQTDHFVIRVSSIL